MPSRKLATVFADNYAERVKSSQGEIYDEIEHIINSEVDKFISKTGKKPVLLDIGSAGLFLYDTNNISKITILDIFPKPDNVKLTDNSEWIVGSILTNNINSVLPNREYDIIIMASLLHHLCDAKNKIMDNLQVCFNNAKTLLKTNGKVYIFESTCPYFLAKLQDFLYPIYSYILIRILKFTYVRMTALREILEVLRESDFSTSLIYFKQPKYISLLFKKIPVKFVPLKMYSIVAYLRET